LEEKWAKVAAMLEQTEADILAFSAFPTGLREGGGPRPLNQRG
jgi:hypothetical protein